MYGVYSTVLIHIYSVAYTSIQYVDVPIDIQYAGVLMDIHLYNTLMYIQIHNMLV